MKKLDVTDYSLAHLILILLTHYLVKFKSRSLAVHNNEFILGSACVGSKVINRITTNTSNSYYLSKSHTCYITSFLLPHVLKMFSFSTNASRGRWRDSPTVRLITYDTEQLTRCWCVISVRWCTVLK